LPHARRTERRKIRLCSFTWREQEVPVTHFVAAGVGIRLGGGEGEIAMEDTKLRRGTRRKFADVLPETLEEADELAASIERAVQQETGRGVDDLTVEVGPQGILLRGRCTTYYTKQLAQHAAMGMPGGERLINSIEVS
jgi:hypothetical protein